MQRSMKITVFSTLAAGVAANECSAGYIHKKDLTGLQCMGNREDAASCNTECCEIHKGTCGGLASQSPSKVKCDWDQYQPQETAALNTLATEDNAKTMCCKPKATCAQAVCKAGYKNQNPTIKCSGDVDSCIDSVCCTKDTATCGGQTAINCHPAPNSVLAPKGFDDAWKKTAITGVVTQASFQTACCDTTAKKCSAAVCPAGQKKVAAAATLYCTDGREGFKSSQATDCNRDGVNYLNLVTAKDAVSFLAELKKLAETAPTTGATNYEANYDAAKLLFENPDTVRQFDAMLGDKTKVAEFLNAFPAFQALHVDLKTSGTQGAVDYSASPQKTVAAKVPKSQILPLGNACCAADAATCGGFLLASVFGATPNYNPCGAGFVQSSYGDAWAGITGVTNAATFVTKCCKAQTQSCSSYTCPAGKTQKVGVKKMKCSGSSATCETTCCQPDTKKCGGYMNNVQCKYGTFYEPDNWVLPGDSASKGKATPQATVDEWMNRAANATNKNTKCCTERVACAIGTTTPYPTATPAAPALKYSEHKVKGVKKEKEEGSKLLWAGAGAITGMAVLSLVQVFRGKKSTVATSTSGSDSEDDLLNSFE